MTYPKIWGPKAWNLLHSFSINNNLKIPISKKHNYYIFYTTFIHILPCPICSVHYSGIINYAEPLIEDKITRKYLKKWVFKIHNIINEILDKEEYSYKEFIDKEYIINHEDIFFIVHTVYLSFDYDNISLDKYDQIYNFFINFCLLYPDLKIRKILKKKINSKDFKKIETPNDFKKWFINFKYLY